MDSHLMRSLRCGPADACRNLQMSQSMTPLRVTSTGVCAKVGDLGRRSALVGRAVRTVLRRWACLLRRFGSLQNGSASMQNGSASMGNGFASLQNGSASMQNGSASLQNDFSSLQNGFSSMQNGSASLQNGFASMRNGFSSLQNGFATMKNGSARMHGARARALRPASGLAGVAACGLPGATQAGTVALTNRNDAADLAARLGHTPGGADARSKRVSCGGWAGCAGRCRGTKGSIKLKRHRAAWNDDVLAQLLGLRPVDAVQLLAQKTGRG